MLHLNQINGTFPSALCDVKTCVAQGTVADTDNSDLVAPCGTTGCCGLDDGETCPPTPAPTEPTPEPTPAPTPEPPSAKPTDKPTTTTTKTPATTTTKTPATTTTKTPAGPPGRDACLGSAKEICKHFPAKRNCKKAGCRWKKKKGKCQPKRIED